ncbi:MAG: cytochrome c1 [Gammaproteobacteria bacterium]|jgi:ubiquinol-cytochrome c reductase cytochrome c1 subunit|tara:strand:- start:2320 stop:3018 length:699 start_codon:yes stop_codon:yes gene_type:complete
MVKIISYLGLIFWAQLSMSSEGGTKLMQANVDIANTVSLQNGAKLFINYCVSCHSAEYMRYNRMAKDLGLSDDMVKKNLMFASDKIGDTMTIAMRPDDAEQWFGVRPPDLSVIARSKGVDYLYSFLNGFYVDPSRPTGVNNHYYPNTAMPHVLWELQGLQDKHGDADKTSSDGEMTSVQYQQATRDLVAFLDYVGEPAKLVRYKIGFWVIAFLLVLFLVACMVKKEYWKDIH